MAIDDGQGVFEGMKAFRTVDGRVAGAYTRSTFQLNLSALYVIGGARRGCVARVKGVLGAG